jgi:hypothetical protein
MKGEKEMAIIGPEEDNDMDGQIACMFLKYAGQQAGQHYLGSKRSGAAQTKPEQLHTGLLG